MSEGSRATPRDAAGVLEAAPSVARGRGARFSGYGVLGMGFASGHVLALRRITGSSLGPGFATVWHRDPAGRWRFHTDADPDTTCARYFGVAGELVREDAIAIEWQGSHLFSVRVPGPKLAWVVHLAPAPAARTLRTLARGLPGPLRHHAAVRRVMDAATARLLRVDELTMEGRTPSGHGFRLDTDAFWLVDGSTARCGGEHLGPAVSLRAPVRLGDFRVPQWGLFTVGGVHFEGDERPA
jgi:hypothetical protein